MTDEDRDELEATLQRADELEQANEALAARNAALVAGTPAPVLAKRNSGAGYTLAATSIIAGILFAMIPGCEVLAALGFMLPLFWVIAVTRLRFMQWLEKNDVL
jgi:hypothetical protein